MSKILIIEDDPNIRAELKTLLDNNGYETEILSDFTDTDTDTNTNTNTNTNTKTNTKTNTNTDSTTDIPARILASTPDLVLLDINLPVQNGEAILKTLRESSEIPVIMVTSRDTELDEALSISFGADDYITKPYNPNILLLRIAAVLRRTTPKIETPLYNHPNLQYDPNKGELINTKRSPNNNAKTTQKNTKRSPNNNIKTTQKISLTKNEMLIFNHLLYNNNRIVSRNELMTLLWDNQSFLNDSTLTTNISRLRDKLAQIGLENAIETKKGQGYLLNLAN